MDEVGGIMREIMREFDRSASLLHLKLLDSFDFNIPEDISQIQNLHDLVVQDLDTLGRNLESHLSIVEKTELIMNILTYKQYELQFHFRSQFDDLKAKKDALLRLPGVTERPSISLKLIEIDEQISGLEENNQKNFEYIRQEKLDSQKSYERAVQILDENFEKMNIGLNKLLVLIEAEKSSLSDSQAQLVDIKFQGQIKDIKDDIERYTQLQTSGWKVLYPEEKISEMLHERGLKVLQSGQLIDKSGHALTFKEAKEKNLLSALNSEAMNELKASILPDLSSGSSITSVNSGMSTEDVHYLKEYLGKPLTLALAEITSVQPRDPIHYLGHWLFKYRYNQQMEDVNSIEVDILNDKRHTLAKQRWHKFIEEEARAAVIDMIIRAEEIAYMNEVNRMMRAEDDEEEAYDDEARDVLAPLQ